MCTKKRGGEGVGGGGKSVHAKGIPQKRAPAACPPQEQPPLQCSQAGPTASHFQQIKATNLVNESKSAQMSRSALPQGGGSVGAKLSTPACCPELPVRMLNRRCCSNPAREAGPFASPWACEVSRRARVHRELSRGLQPLPPHSSGGNQLGSSCQPQVHDAEPAGTWKIGPGVALSPGAKLSGRERDAAVGLGGAVMGVLGCAGGCCGFGLGQGITDSPSRGCCAGELHPSGPSASQEAG